MNFEEWYNETYDPNFGKEHKEWEEKAWKAAIKEAMIVLMSHGAITDTNGIPIFPEVACDLRKLGE